MSRGPYRDKAEMVADFKPSPYSYLAMSRWYATLTPEQIRREKLQKHAKQRQELAEQMAFIFANRMKGSLLVEEAYRAADLLLQKREQLKQEVEDELEKHE